MGLALLIGAPSALAADKGKVKSAKALSYQIVEVDSPSEIKGSTPARASTPAGRSVAAMPYIPLGQGYAGDVEPNNTSATATPLSATNLVVRGNLFPSGDIDFYAFTANAGDRVYAATMTAFSAGNSTDSQLTLLASDGTTTVEFDDDNGSFAGLSSSIAGATLPATGTYFLRVNDFTAGTASERPYELHLRIQSGAPTPEVEANDTPATANPLPANGWVSGARNPAVATEQDWFSLTLNAGDTVYLSLDTDPERDGTSWNGRLGVALFGDANNQIVVVDDAGTGDVSPNPNIPSEALFMTVKNAGTYFAFVDSASAAVGGPTSTYHLSVSVHPATNEGVNCTTYTSTNVPQTIGPGTGLVSSTITVPGNPRIADLDVEIVLNHALMQDIDAHLRSPAGNDNGLFSDIGAAVTGGQAQMDTVFDDEAGIPPSFTVLRGTQIKPELNYRLGWFDGEDAGGVWTLDLRDDTAGANGGTLTSWSLRICEVPPPPACPAGFVTATVLSTDFESGAAGFTHSGTADEWELGLPATLATTTANPIADFTSCNSGVNCWKTDLDNTYNVSSNQDLLSPAINLAGLSPPVVVTWAQRYQMESANFDHMFVDAQQVGGGTPVRLFEWLDATMTDPPGNPTVNVGASAGWALRSARADSLAGVNSELRFHLDSDTTVNFGGLAIDDVTVTACRAASADLSITKTDGVTTAVPGGSVTYSIVASNAGTDPVTAATVADTFPAALTCTWTCTGTSGGGTCTASGSGNINDAAVNLPASSSVTYTASCAVSASATGTLSNTATVSSSITDPVPGNNSATDTDTLTPQADLGITKTDGVATATPGGSVTYTITASNAGPSNAPGSTVADTFPASLTCNWTCVGAGGGTCTAAGAGNINDSVNLPSGGSVSYTAICPISASASGTLSNTATVTAGAGVTDPTPGNNSATDTDTLSPQANLGITKTDGVTAVTPGGSTTYTITSSNAGPSNAPGSTVADTFPAALTCTWTCVGAGGGTCTAAGSGNINDTVNLPSGGSTTHVAVCTISGAATGTLSNTATVTAGAGVTDPTPGNNSATDTDTIAASANLAITKTDGVTTATPGGSVTYTITASNAGPSAAPGSTVADPFPAALTCTWTCVGAGGGTCTAAGSGNINDTVNLPSGGSVTHTASCTISAAASGTLVNTATIAAGAGVVDPVPGNNSATDTDTLAGSADLSISKTDGVATVSPNGSTTYTIVSSNAGPSNVTGATVADPFPATLTCTWACTGTGGGTCTAAGSGNINDTVNLPSGGSTTHTASCTVSAAASGSIANTATVTAPAGVTDPAPGNNTATDTDTVAAPGALTITPPTASFGSVAIGSTSAAQTVTLSNTGGSPLQVTALTAAAAPFAAAGGSCGAVPITLAAGGSCTLLYTFSPTAAGTATQAFTVTTNVPSTGSFSLTGSGGNGVVGVLAANLDFGAQLVGASGQRTLTITNTGSGPLQVTGISAVTPPFAQVAGGTCGPVPFTLAAGASCTVLYSFTPGAAGVFSQVVTITADVGTATATLTGRGVVATQIPALGSRGTGLLLLVIGFGSMLVLRRRG